MTLIKPGFGISALSGKLGGTIYSRNRGGMYAKAWASPVQPDSSDQTDKWAIWQEAADAYNSLSSENLDRWHTYAQQVTGSNRLGEPIRLTGQQVFWECFTNASLNGFTPLTVPNASTNRPAISSVFGLIVGSDGSDLNIFFVNHTEGIAPSGESTRMLISAAPCQRATVRNVNNQFRLITTAPGTGGLRNILTPYIDKFGSTAEIGWNAHVKIRVVDTGSWLGGNTILLSQQITS